MVDNTDNNPSSTTANDSFHGTSVSLAWQEEAEGEMRMLSESVDPSTRKYGFNYLPADYTHVSTGVRHQNSLCLCCKGTAVKSSRGDGKL